GGDRKGGPGGRGVAVVAGPRRVVDRRDGEDHAGKAAGRGAVCGPVGEAVGAVEVEVRRVGERTVGVQGQRAAAGAAHEDGPEGIAVHIGVVGEHSGGGDDQHRVLGGAVSVAGGCRGIVHRGDGDADRGDVAVHGAVVGPVRKAVRAVIVRGRAVGEG